MDSETATRRRNGRSSSTHGLPALKAKVKLRGLHAIDRRTAAARALLAWRDELITALGGLETVTPQEMALVAGNI